jgi:hypothetical protein
MTRWGRLGGMVWIEIRGALGLPSGRRGGDGGEAFIASLEPTYQPDSFPPVVLAFLGLNHVRSPTQVKPADRKYSSIKADYQIDFTERYDDARWGPARKAWLSNQEPFIFSSFNHLHNAPLCIPFSLSEEHLSCRPCRRPKSPQVLSCPLAATSFDSASRLPSPSPPFSTLAPRWARPPTKTPRP